MDSTRNLLLRSFKTFEGLRGAHFYCQGGCRFLPWLEVIKFINDLPLEATPEFPEKLLSILANYDPDSQFLAVGEIEGKTFIELYAKNHVS